MDVANESLRKNVEDLVDYLMPKLDTYEQAIYLYMFRHTFMEGRSETIVGFKSARKSLCFGVGEKGKPMAEGTCYEKLGSLKAKGCIVIMDTVHSGTQIRLNLPSEIPGLIPPPQTEPQIDIDQVDFFSTADTRKAILEREQHKCFYCLRSLDASNYVIEHVVSRPEGLNNYRNVVAACRNCNNRKNDIPVEEFIRMLYREGFLADSEFKNRLDTLAKLKDGQLKPIFGNDRS